MVRIAGLTVTLSDVARRAGVSEATASRVLNRRRYVSAQTRLRVKAAARDLDYVPNRAARDLSMARTATITLLVHHAQYPAHGEGTFSSRVVDGVSRALRQSGYDLLYVPVDDEAVTRLAALAATRSSRSDGVIVLGPAFPRAALESLAMTGRPAVTIDNRHPGLDAVLADNALAMCVLTRHLVIDHGYGRLACLAGPARWPSTQERVAGIRAVAASAGATLRVLHARETTMRDGAAMTQRLADEAPEALMAINDAMAIGALHRLRHLGGAWQPAITGFDDIAWAQLTDPPLTSVDVDATAVGVEAARLLMARIATAHTDALPAREVRVPATVRLRRSCGCSGEPSAPPG
ncbi:MAG: LacI family DNA-binding transcriptional regulator [Chloroflexota bacterium]